MRNTDQQPCSSFIYALVVLGSMAFGQPALADSEKPAATQALPVSAEQTKAELLSGEKVYENVCIACHYPPGLGGAPGLGDSKAWAVRLDQGIDALIDHALRGYSGNNGIMPRKGGRPDLSDEEIIRAVKYMVGKAGL